MVVDNFGQGATKRLGIDHDSLQGKFQNNHLFYKRFGDTGVNRPAYDNIVQGYSGAMSITGTD